MGGCTQYEIPAKLKEAQERFEQWRSSQAGRRPIPEPLWVLASELARQHGVFRTAQVLRLDSTSSSGARRGGLRRRYLYQPRHQHSSN